jgi:hypothetical protein
MSIFDILTKWALDKLDNESLAKKNGSDEILVKGVYFFIEQLPKLAEAIADEIYRIAVSDDDIKDLKQTEAFGKSETVVGIFKELEWNITIKEKHIKLSKFIKEFNPRVNEDISEHVRDLKLLFNKEGFKGLDEEILGHFSYLSNFLVALEDQLPNFHASIEVSDEGRYQKIRGTLLESARGMRQRADAIRKTAEILLRFSYKIQI